MAAEGEVACPGGEVAFVRAIIRDSLRLKQRVIFVVDAMTTTMTLLCFCFHLFAAAPAFKTSTCTQAPVFFCQWLLL